MNFPFVKEKSIALDKYFELIKPKYNYLRITPDKSILSEQNTAVITKAMKATYKTIFDKIKFENKKVWFETNFKISYIIDMNKDGASFIFMIPQLYFDSIFEKISSIWPRCEFDMLTYGIPEHSKDVKCYKLMYKKEDALSLNTSRKTELMGQLLSNVELLQDDDRVTVIYNFIPSSDFNWDSRYEATLDKLYNNRSVVKNKFDWEHLLLGTFNVIDTTINQIIEGLNAFISNGNNKIDEKYIMDILRKKFNMDYTPSSCTREKREGGIIETQMVYLIDGKDRTRNEIAANSVSNCFRAVDGDNTLVSRKIKKTFKLEDYKFNNVETNSMSTLECNALVQLPTREQSKAYEVEYIEVTQESVPEILRHGYVRLGTTNYRGERQLAYLEDGYNIGNLPLVIAGEQGSGKTTYLGHLYKYASQRGEGGVVLDYIKNNEMTEDILKFVPMENVILLDFMDSNCIQSFAFNELKFADDTSPFEKRDIISRQAQKLLDLINSINPDKQLEPRMRKYLVASANIVLSAGESSLKEVVRCLQVPEIRNNYIQIAMQTDMAEFLQTKADELLELNGQDKQGGLTNKDDRVSGILDRISVLREDFKLEYMFDKSATENIDFADELDKGKLIIIKMPQDEFSDHARDVIATFFVSKIWLATVMRGSRCKEPKRTYISIDEIFSVPTAKRMITEKSIIQQTRKFGCKFNLTCQSFKQMPELIGSCMEGGGSFMLLKGTKAQDFNLLKSRAPEYEYSDLVNLPQYSSLNIINTTEGYFSFVTTLPYEKK